MAGPIYNEGATSISRTLGTSKFVLDDAALTTGLAVGDTFYYSAVNIDNPQQTEAGIGTLNADGTISRAAINRGLTNFSAGKKQVSMTQMAPVPVAIVSGGSSGGGSSGGLTNVELRAAPVPISGSVNVGNWPSSWAVTGPLTNAELRATPIAISGSVTANVPNGLDVDVLSLPALPAGGNAIGSVIVSNLPATQAVSGTVSISGTVPVSGPLTDTQLRAAAVAVSGTFWQATQPVSIAATVNVSIQNASLAVTQSGTWNVAVSNFPATQAVSIAATVATRDLKDNGRTLIGISTVIAGVACVTSEALLSMIEVKAGVAAAAATSFAVTSGKTRRITAIVLGIRSTAAAVLSARFGLRINPSGAATATSPLLATFSLSQQSSALAEAGDEITIPLPDGIEISGTQQIGLTQLCSATTGVVYASLLGFEY